MSAFIETFQTPLIAIACMAFGVTAGMLIERVRWNNLISEGKLPRPAKSRS
jgi:hypothetical protein